LRISVQDATITGMQTPAPNPPDDFTQNPVFLALPQKEQDFLASLQLTYRLSYQMMRMLVEQAADLTLWKETPLSELWDEEAGKDLQGKPRAKAILEDLIRKTTLLRQQETDYSSFEPPDILPAKPVQVVTSPAEETILGRCPCPVSGEKTRCCNLETLDAVRQCGFACSYCSIQSFYHDNEVLFMDNLHYRLENLKLGPQSWHIGTGQASDSLMWGDDHGLLTALGSFARRNPDLVLELKTKSARTDWVGKIALPQNVLATWSLNAPTIIEKEEHLTATLHQRLRAARKVADSRLLVGFHLHPLVYFKGWEEEYGEVVHQITTLFKPEEVALVSLGTLTFTKAVLRQLRSSGKATRILEMELVESAGKFSYPVAVKKKLFSHAMDSFPTAWKTENGPFFYLCMELPELWEPVLHRSYPDNATFERDMRKAYTGKISALRQKNATSSSYNQSIVDNSSI